jgi:WD40 repeat protein
VPFCSALAQQSSHNRTQDDSLSHVGDACPVQQTHVCFVSRSQFASGSSDGAVAVWEASARTRISCHQLPGPVSSLVSWRNLIFAAGGNCDVLVLDWRTFESVGVLRGHIDIVHLAEKMCRKNVLATASLDKSLRVWSVPACICARTMPFDDCIVSMSASEDSDLTSMFALFEDNVIRRINVENGQTLLRFQINHDISPAFILVINESLFVAWRNSEVPQRMLPHKFILLTLRGLIPGNGINGLNRKEIIKICRSLRFSRSHHFFSWRRVLLLQFRNNLLLGVSPLGRF